MQTACTSRLAFLNPRVLIGITLYAAGVVLALAPMSSATAEDNAAAEVNQSVPVQAPGRWRITGDLVTARYVHKATLLQNGQVLVAGGYGPDGVTILASAELYDPATGVWTATGRMNGRRSEHTATLLPNGQVLVAGLAIARAELYDPASGSWTITARLLPVRYRHAATLLRNGTVLVSGGYNPFPGVGVLALAELYKSAPEMVDIP